MASSGPLGSDRKLVLLTSFALGFYSLFIVPIYFTFINGIVMAEPGPIFVTGRVVVSGVPIMAGESSLLVLLFLIVVPLLIRQGSRRAILATIFINLLLIPLEWIGLGYPPILPSRYPYFQRVAGCTLVSCGMTLDHALFHLSHLPFYIAVISFSLRAYWATK